MAIVHDLEERREDLSAAKDILVEAAESAGFEAEAAGPKKLLLKKEDNRLGLAIVSIETPEENNRRLERDYDLPRIRNKAERL